MDLLVKDARLRQREGRWDIAIEGGRVASIA
jgi:hypothetical protein